MFWQEGDWLCKPQPPLSPWPYLRELSTLEKKSKTSQAEFSMGRGALRQPTCWFLQQLELSGLLLTKPREAGRSSPEVAWQLCCAAARGGGRPLL